MEPVRSLPTATMVGDVLVPAILRHKPLKNIVLPSAVPLLVDRCRRRLLRQILRETLEERIRISYSSELYERP